jgi:hypothetical protein
MGDRLTTEDVADLLGDNELRVGDAYMTAHEAVALLTELKERRAADLSSEEREALRWLRNVTLDAACGDASCPDHDFSYRALSTLSKILKDGT